MLRIPEQPGAAIRALADTVEALALEDVESTPSDALGDQLIAMRRAMDRLEAEFSRRLARFDRCGGAASAGAVNTAGWLRWRCRLSGPAAAERVEVARQLLGLAATAEAFRRGDIGYQHAAVVARTATDVGVEPVKNAEPALIEAARELDPGSFRHVSQHLRHHLDPEEALNAANALHARRFLRVSQAPHGGFALEGMLDPEGGALLRTALNAVAGPPARDDQRTAGQRRADALLELVAGQLRAGVPSVHGQRPHLIVTAVATEAGSGGAFRHGEIQGAGPIPSETVERLACDASLTSVTTDTGGRPLDVGRTSRTASAAIRTALKVRDKGCRFPGCDRPPEWTDTHHVDPWAKRGETRVSNLVLLCRRHHRLMHEHGWSMRLSSSGEVEILGPDGPVGSRPGNS